MEVSSLTKEQLRRVETLAWAICSKKPDAMKGIKAEDVEWMAVRLEELDLDELSAADPLMRWTLRRLEEDRAQKAAWLEDAIENVRTAELCLNEAIEAEAAVRALIDKTMFRNGSKINDHWDEVTASYRAAGLLPDFPEAPDATIPEPMPEAVATPASAPQPDEAEETEPAVDTPEPETPALTEKQTAMFEALVSVADVDWRATISHGRLKALTGISLGSVSQILWALELKDHVRALERGSAKTPATYLICEGVRPDRLAAPKTDAELIAEAISAGRVTKVPSPGTPKVH